MCGLADQVSLCMPKMHAFLPPQAVAGACPPEAPRALSSAGSLTGDIVQNLFVLVWGVPNSVTLTPQQQPS